jgi:hypothetical protein
MSTTPYPLPREIDYIVLDVFDPLTFLSHGFYRPQGYKNLQALMGQATWNVVEHLDGFVVLRRSSGDTLPASPLVEIKDPDSIVSGLHPAEMEGGEGDVQLVGVCMGQTDADSSLPITLCWTKPVETGNDYDMLMEVRDGSYVGWKRISPGSRIWPPQSWPAGRLVLDHHRIRLDNHTGPLHQPQIKVYLRLIPPPSATSHRLDS